MKVFVVKQYGSRKVGDFVPDMPDTTAKDLIIKGFVSEIEPKAVIETASEQAVVSEVVETEPKVETKKNRKGR